MLTSVARLLVTFAPRYTEPEQGSDPRVNRAGNTVTWAAIAARNIGSQAATKVLYVSLQGTAAYACAIIVRHR